MPTKKPKIQTVLEEEYYEIFKKICKIQDRSESKMSAIIIKDYIDKYKENEEHQKLKSKLSNSEKIG